MPSSLPNFLVLVATSKDVSIGPVAVMSLQTGRIVADVIASHGKKVRTLSLISRFAWLMVLLGYLASTLPKSLLLLSRSSVASSSLALDYFASDGSSSLSPFLPSLVL
jgi:hypothetical protein